MSTNHNNKIYVWKGYLNPRIRARYEFGIQNDDTIFVKLEGSVRSNDIILIDNSETGIEDWYTETTSRILNTNQYYHYLFW